MPLLDVVALCCHIAVASTQTVIVGSSVIALTILLHVTCLHACVTAIDTLQLTTLHYKLSSSALLRPLRCVALCCIHWCSCITTFATPHSSSLLMCFTHLFACIVARAAPLNLLRSTQLYGCIVAFHVARSYTCTTALHTAHHSFVCMYCCTLHTAARHSICCTQAPLYSAL
jgi:hypothetical protein